MLTEGLHDGSKLSMAEMVRSNMECKVQKPSEEWIVVNRRRLRNRFVGNIGIANNSESKFKAADSKVQLFISNVHKDTLETDITDYVFHKTQEKVTLARMHCKKDKGHNSFKLWVSKKNLDLFLDSKLWPEGISFRKFINFHSRREVEKKETENNRTHNG